MDLHEVQDSAAFIKLTSQAKNLYGVFLRHYTGRNNGSLAVTFDVAEERNVTSNRGVYYRALAMLQAHGLLEQTRSAVTRGQPTAARYALTCFAINEPTGQVRHDAKPTAKGSRDYLQWKPECPTAKRAKEPAKKKKRGANPPLTGVQICNFKADGIAIRSADLALQSGISAESGVHICHSSIDICHGTGITIRRTDSGSQYGVLQ